MREIPEHMPSDILNTAAEAVEAMPHRAPFKADVLYAIALAILAERDRCASIVEARMYDFGCIAGTDAADFVTVCAELAVDIRSSSKATLSPTTNTTLDEKESAA